MKFTEYGDKDGQLVIYFHGAPGGIEECALFDSYAKKHGLKVICLDRFSLDDPLGREGYYKHIADQIKSKAGDQAVDIIGFSIGAHVALEVSVLLNDQVRHTHLISAVAPIDADDFIDNMAGGIVFKLAMGRPFIFRLLTQYQKLMALLAPRILFNMLFASAVGKDRELSERDDFKSRMIPVLRHCFRNNASGYMRDINFYVTWEKGLGGHASDVHLWHGTEDNWSPFAMASYLSTMVSGATYNETMEGLSHYSCLYEAIPKICSQLEGP